MVVSNVALMPLDRTIYGTRVLVGGAQKHFQRPFLLEFVMFLAMASCLLFEIPCWRRQNQSNRLWPSRRVCLKLLVPALCDLFGSWFIFGGALWVNASVVEMLSATNTIFTAMLSLWFLGKRIARHEWIGIVLSVFGVVVVGLANFASPTVTGDDNAANSGTYWLTPLGMLFVIIAHFWYAVEFVVTEKLLGDNDLSAFVSVGMMGLWGSAICAGLFPLLWLTPSVPEAYAPLWHEEFGSSLATIGGRPALLSAIVALFLALLVFNAAAFKTTELLSAMARVVIGSLVSPLVWALDLLLAVTFGGGAGAAERLSAWSGLQLLGFALLLSGTLAYNAVGPFARLAAGASCAGSLAEQPQFGVSLTAAGAAADE